MTQEVYSIKDAVKRTGVEAHVLRYWEEELGIQVPRNAQSRRYYTEENIELFQKIKGWKEQGLQLKAIRQILEGKDSGLMDVPAEEVGRRIILYHPKEKEEPEVLEKPEENLSEKEEKSRRLQELLKQFITESVKESNEEMLKFMRDGLLKELDYQFRLQEERETEREKVRLEKEDAHFKQLDESLRNAASRGKRKRFFLF